MPKSCIYIPGVGLEGSIYAANMSFVNIYRINGSIKSEFESKIIKLSTEAMVDNAKEVLTGALPNRVCNADNNIKNFGAIFIGQISGTTKIVVNGKIIKVLIRARFGNTENVVAI